MPSSQLIEPPTRTPKHPCDAAKQYEQALQLTRTKDYENARLAFENIHNCCPQHSKAWISHAQMQKRRLASLGPSVCYEGCRSVLERGVRANPAAAEIIQAWGLLELQQQSGCHDVAAVELLDRAVQLQPSLSPVLGWQTVQAARKRVQQKHQRQHQQQEA